MTVRELAQKLGARAVCEPEPDRQVCGCYTGDLLSWVMGRAQADNVWVTIMTNINTIAVATLADVSCVVIAEGAELDEAAAKTAEAKGVNVYSSPLSSYSLCAAISDLI